MAGIKQFDEDEVLERMVDVFWVQGFGATSMQDLAQATGVLRGSLYHAYGDKEALFLRAYERYKTRFIDAVRATLDNPVLETALQDFFDYTISSMTVANPAVAEHGNSTRGCLTTKTATDEAATVEPIRLALRSLVDELEMMLLDRLTAPDAQARLRLPAKEAARLMITTTRGIVVMERIYHEKAQLTAIATSLLAILIDA